MVHTTDGVKISGRFIVRYSVINGAIRRSTFLTGLEAKETARTANNVVVLVNPSLFEMFVARCALAREFEIPCGVKEINR